MSRHYLIKTEMNLFKSILGTFTLLLLSASTIFGQTFTPARSQDKPIAIANATIHVGDGTIIEKGIVYFEKGKIISVVEGGSENVDINKYKLIDAEKKHLYPGLILPISTLGLVEIEAVKASRDNYERGAFNPNIRSIIAYNTDSELIGTLRYNGILLAQITPSGGTGMAGTTSIVQLDAWNWEDAIYQQDDALVMGWPRRFFGPRWWLGESEMRPNPNYDKQVREIKKAFEDAAAYSKSTPETVNIKLEAMKGLFDGSKTLIINPGSIKNVVSSVQTVQSLGVKRIVVVGNSELLMVKEFLKENNISVILEDIHGLPEREGDNINLPYKLPALLKKEGIKFCFGYFSSVASSRNLPFFAGTATAYGLSKEEALQAMTKDAADILGIGNRTGMIKTGLDANIIVSEGDILDMKTNHLTHAFIQGRQLELTNKQVKLYEKYKKKYNQK
ncbi:MAG: amidohydrolase family protein [Flammeovirgaceae bacterium]